MQLKMESSNGKSKQQSPQQPPPSPSTVASSSAAGVSPSTSAQQHQNGASQGGSVVSNGAKFRSRSSTTPSSSSLPTPTSAHSWPQQYRVVNTLPLRILVLKDLVGAIIGRQGGTIKQITQETHARVDVHRKEHSTPNENVIMIYGSPENCSQACRRILEVMQQEARTLNRPEEIVLKILASNNLIGRIIGKGGNTIKRIMQQTETKITVSSANLASQINLERVISIAGQLENMCKAEVLISQKLRQCFENDMYQYQQSLLYSGLHSPIPPVMAHPQAGPLSISSGYASGPHPSHGQQSLSYSLGPASQSLSGRPGVLSSSQALSSASSSTGQSSHHLHSVPPPTATQTAYYGGYNIPYFYSHGPATAGNIPGTYSTGPAGTPYLGLSYIHPATMPNVDSVKETVTVFIPNSVVGAIIGRGGQTIRDMMNQSGASIKVTQQTDEESASSPSPSATSPSPDQKIVERKVTVMGTPNAQYLAQYCIFQKVFSELCNQVSSSSSASSPVSLYGDPMILKVEILVPTNQVRRIIGKSGSVIQELQRTTGATIKLSKETPPPTSASSTSANGTPDTADKSAEKSASTATSFTPIVVDNDMTAVHIIGDFHASFAAQRQIRLIVFRSTNVPSSSHPQFSPQQQTKSAKTTSSTTISSCAKLATTGETSDVSKSKPAASSITSTSSSSNTALTAPPKSDNTDNSNQANASQSSTANS